MEENAGLVSRSRVDSLNAREREILDLLRKGLSNKQIAVTAGLSIETVKWYNKQMFAKLGVGSRTQAVARALQMGLFEREGLPVPGKESPPRHNLPAFLSTFIGRTKEVREVEQLLDTNRLVTLTGAGGSGKTRLALEVASKFLGRYRDGIWLVELAPLADPALVVSAIAGVCGLAAATGDSLDVALRRFLSHKHLLLILDNFEHLMTAAPLVAAVLSGAPQVTVLVTSRERLHISGEHEYVVSPLALPDLGRNETLEQVLAYDAVHLFIDRAQAVRPGMTINELQARAAARICEQLDGLPLAIELAASQVKMYTLPQLAEQLRHHLAVSLGGPRDLPARQRTLRATLEWSHSLLNSEEKVLFARLAVFNSATLDAIKTVCGDQGLANVRACATSLVDQNLLVPREGQDGELHFFMLETIREYSVERLEESGEADRLRRRHVRYFTELAELADSEIRGPRHVYWFARQRAERQNVRSAIQFALSSDETGSALRLVAALGYFWFYDGSFIEEARRYAVLALRASAGAPVALAAGVGITAGRIAAIAGDRAGSKRMLADAYDAYRGIGDEYHAAWCLLYLSACQLSTPQEAREGLKPCQKGLAYFRSAQDPHGMSQGLNIMGELARRTGDYRGAEAYYKECLQIAQGTSEGQRIAMQYANLSIVAYHLNQADDAGEMSKQAVRMFLEMDSVYGAATSLIGLAGSAILKDAPDRAAHLLGAANALLEGLGARYQPGDQYEVDGLIAESRHRLGEAAFQAAWETGAAMTFQKTIAYVLDVPVAVANDAHTGQPK